MHIPNVAALQQLPRAHFHNPEVVRAIIQQIVLMEGAGQRRIMLAALVEQLIAAGELEEAVYAARLAPVLTPHTFVNDVDYFLKESLLLLIVDQLLDQQQLERAVQLLDEAALGLQDLPRYDRDDMPAEEPWLQLTRRYARADLPVRMHQVWDRALVWARALEQSLAIPERHFFQPEEGTYFLARIAEDMARLGQFERATEVAASIADKPMRARALALVRERIAGHAAV